MIIFEGVTSTLSTMGLRTTVLDRASITLPSNQHLVILGQEGSGKTSLIRLLAGSMLPDQGRIARHARVSFPAGFTGGYKRDLNVRENIAHAAYLYGADGEEVVRFVSKIAELDGILQLDFGDLPPQLRLRVAYAVSYAIPFDTYLIDGRVAMGDSEFKLRCERIFEERIKHCGFILTTSNPRYARRIGRVAAILHKGRLSLYEDMDRAIWDFRHLEKSVVPTPLGGRESEIPDESEI